MNEQERQQAQELVANRLFIDGQMSAWARALTAEEVQLLYRYEQEYPSYQVKIPR